MPVRVFTNIKILLLYLFVLLFGVRYAHSVL
jgi:hypothetical protein